MQTTLTYDLKPTVHRRGIPGRWRGLMGLTLGLMVCLATACGQADPAGQAAADSQDRTYPYRVVATTGMVADIVRQVAGDRAEVVNLIGEGVDPHLYKPTRGDVNRLLQADMIFYNGLLLEGRMTDTLIRIASGGKPVHAVTDLIDEQSLLESDEYEGHPDPHVWMDASAWAKAVDAVADKLVEFDPDHTQLYRDNAATYQQQLDALHAYVRQVIGSIPDSQRVLVTAHDAFNYFGRAYDIDVMGIQGLSTESEAGVEDINRLVNYLVSHQIGAVFVETSVSDRNVRALIEGARARGHTVQIGGELFSDAMGTPGTYEGTYVGMIDHNATTIARALGGTAPAGGMQGKLARQEAVQ